MNGFQQGEYWTFQTLSRHVKEVGDFRENFELTNRAMPNGSLNVKRSIDDRIDQMHCWKHWSVGKCPDTIQSRSSATTTTTTRGKEYFTSQGQKHRDEAVTRPMLDFHNFVKSTLYDTIFSIVGANQSLFEMSGGRGGDLWKAQLNREKFYCRSFDGRALACRDR